MITSIRMMYIMPVIYYGDKMSSFIVLPSFRLPISSRSLCPYLLPSCRFRKLLSARFSHCQYTQDRLTESAYLRGSC